MIILISILFVLLIAGFIYWRFQGKKTQSPAAKPLPASQPQTAPTPQELPNKYGKDEIVLMVKDPYWLYSYWEISDATIENLKRQYGTNWDNSHPVLRIYDLTNHPYDFLNAPFFEIAITDLADNWYINTGQPNRTYCIDLGRWIPNHGFITIARSNIVTTPADQPSNEIDPLWPPVEVCWEAVSRYTTNKKYPGSSPTCSTTSCSSFTLFKEE
ncbi:MAG: uncharacterized protein PWP31_702 [Clostridia bacterium]|nr:uncharacterized protein [Clostridia bacterium]